MYFGMVGGVLFILIQLVLLVDFANIWNASWLVGVENNKCWFVGKKQFAFKSCLMQ